MKSNGTPPWRVMTFFPAVGIAAFLYFDVHPDWFLIPGGSAPQGLWHVTEHANDAHYERGDWIIVCPPISAAEHRQLFVEDPPDDHACTSQRSLKQIAAVPGDRVTVNFPYVVTPLRTVEAVAVDNSGDLLPRPSDGDYIVADATYWVLSQNDRSVDSRYYGSVSTRNILKAAQPIVTMP